MAQANERKAVGESDSLAVFRIRPIISTVMLVKTGIQCREIPGFRVAPHPSPGVMLPAAVKQPLLRHLQAVKRQHHQELDKRLGRVALPNALERKYPNAGN